MQTLNAVDFCLFQGVDRIKVIAEHRQPTSGKMSLGLKQTEQDGVQLQSIAPESRNRTSFDNRLSLRAGEQDGSQTAVPLMTGIGKNKQLSNVEMSNTLR